MYAWLSTQIGADAASVVYYILLTIAVLLVAWLCFSLARRSKKGIFVVMGKNRQMRLSVRDAAAVDNHRRIVLVRRDDVEHLIMIGGPSDVVIECNITPPDVELRKQQEKSVVSHKAVTEQPVQAPVEKAVKKPVEEISVAEVSTKQKTVEKEVAAQEEIPDTVLQPPLKTEQRDISPEREKEPGRILPPPASETIFAPQVASQPTASPAPAPAAVAPAAARPQAQPPQPHQTAQRPVAQPPHPGSRQPAAPNSALHFAGRQAVNQPQAHPGYPAMAPAKRPQPGPAQQESAGMSAFTTRENKTADRPEAAPGLAATPRGNLSDGFERYPGYTPQHASGTSTPPFITPKKNPAATANGDLSGINPGSGSRPAHASMPSYRREPLLDLSESNHEALFRNTALSEEEDFDKILQEELLRSQNNMTTASSNKN